MELASLFVETGGAAMETGELQRKIAYLEFVHDQLITERQEVNELLIEVGFPEGIRSIVSVANEIIHEGVEEQQEEF